MKTFAPTLLTAGLALLAANAEAQYPATGHGTSARRPVTTADFGAAPSPYYGQQAGYYTPAPAGRCVPGTPGCTTPVANCPGGYCGPTANYAGGNCANGQCGPANCPNGQCGPAANCPNGFCGTVPAGGCAPGTPGCNVPTAGYRPYAYPQAGYQTGYRPATYPQAGYQQTGPRWPSVSFLGLGW